MPCAPQLLQHETKARSAEVMLNCFFILELLQHETKVRSVEVMLNCFFILELLQHETKARYTEVILNCFLFCVVSKKPQGTEGCDQHLKELKAVTNTSRN